MGSALLWIRIIDAPQATIAQSVVASASVWILITILALISAHRQAMEQWEYGSESDKFALHTTIEKALSDSQTAKNSKVLVGAQQTLSTAQVLTQWHLCRILFVGLRGLPDNFRFQSYMENTTSLLLQTTVSTYCLMWPFVTALASFVWLWNRASFDPESTQAASFHRPIPMRLLLTANASLFDDLQGLSLLTMVTGWVFLGLALVYRYVAHLARTRHQPETYPHPEPKEVQGLEFRPTPNAKVWLANVTRFGGSIWPPLLLRQLRRRPPSYGCHLRNWHPQVRSGTCLL